MTLFRPHCYQQRSLIMAWTGKLRGWRRSGESIVTRWFFFFNTKRSSSVRGPLPLSHSSTSGRFSQVENICDFRCSGEKWFSDFCAACRAVIIMVPLAGAIIAVASPLTDPSPQEIQPSRQVAPAEWRNNRPVPQEEELTWDVPRVKSLFWHIHWKTLSAHQWTGAGRLLHSECVMDSWYLLSQRFGTLYRREMEFVSSSFLEYVAERFHAFDVNALEISDF